MLLTAVAYLRTVALLLSKKTLFDPLPKILQWPL